MNKTMNSKQQGLLLILSAIVIGIAYQLLSLLPLQQLNQTFVGILGAGFNFVLMFVALYLIINHEFLDWFKHFSFKWGLIGIPIMIVLGVISSFISISIYGSQTTNSINDILSWNYIFTSIPFMLMGEEFLSLAILYGAWKKLKLPFWQASLLCAFLFAVWHLPAYSFNFVQVLITIIPVRMLLNYLFKKSKSIWVTWLVHFAFDFFSFLSVLLVQH